MSARKLRLGDKVSVRDGQITRVCYVSSITSHHIVLRMNDGKLWCLSIEEFNSRMES